MRRIVLVLAFAALLVLMVAVNAGVAFAANPVFPLPPGQHSLGPPPTCWPGFNGNVGAQSGGHGDPADVCPQTGPPPED